MHHARTLIIAAALMLAMPSVASAKISKELRAELTAQLEEHTKSEQVEARRAAILTRAVLEKKKSIKQLKALTEDPDARVRLTAAVALVDAGDRKAKSVLYKQLDETVALPDALRSTVSLLDDKTEAKLLEGYIGAAKPERVEDVLAYLAMQRGPLFDVVVKIATKAPKAKKRKAKKGEKLAPVAQPPYRAMALKVLVSAPRSRVLPVVSKLLKAKKDEFGRRKAVDLAVALHPFAEDTNALTKVLEPVLSGTDAVARAAAIELTGRNVPKGIEALSTIAAAQTEDPAKLELLELIVEAGGEGATVSTKVAGKFALPENFDALAVAIARIKALSGDSKLHDDLVTKFNDFTNYDGRIFAARVLGYTRTRAAGAELTKGLFEGSPQMRRHCAEGLAVAALPDTLTALKKALQRERDLEVLASTFEAVGKIKGSESLQALRLQLTRVDKSLKPVLIDALVAQNDPASVSNLKILGKDLDESIRWKAALGIVALDAKEGAAALSAFSKGTPRGFVQDLKALPEAARKVAFDTLLSKGAPSTKSALYDHFVSRPEVYTSRLDALAGKGAVPKIERLVMLRTLTAVLPPSELSTFQVITRSKAEDPSLRLTSAWTLVRYPEKSLEATYRGFIASDDPSIKSIGMYGLASLYD